MPSIPELVQRIGEELALVPLGQALEDQDKVRITQCYDETYSILKRKGLATWSSTSDIPDSIVHYLSLIMLEQLISTSAYSVPIESFQKIKSTAGNNGEIAFLKLSELLQESYLSDTEVEDF